MPPLRTLIITFLILTGTAEAADPLPYLNRTRPYTGWSSSARGDIRTVGMAGATVGLADTFLAAGTNPAGLAMTLKGGDLSFSSNNIHDGHVQNYDASLSSNAYGAALSAYPWGFGFGYFGAYNEGTSYLAGSPATEVAPELSVRQFEISIARVFFENQLAFGMGVNFGQAGLSVADLSPGGSRTAYHSYAIGANFGLMIQLPRNFLFGASYSTPMHYPATESANQSPVVTNLFQPVEVPSRSTLALGWIPNRFFRADFDFAYIGSTPSAALIRDENIIVGRDAVIIPKLGAAYTFLDYKELQATGFLGTYLEVAREDDSGARLHATAGMELKPWIFTVGWGIDESRHYYNYLFSFGVDVFKILAKADLIPSAWHPIRQGALPNPFHVSDLGLARPLDKNWKQRGPEMNPIDIISDIPTKLGEKVEDIADTVSGTNPDPKPSPTPTPKPKPKPRAVPKTKLRTKPRAGASKAKIPTRKKTRSIKRAESE